MNYYEIALPLALDKTLTYSTESILHKGCRVVISLRNTLYTGIVWRLTETPQKKIKYLPIVEIIDQNPLLPQEILNLAEWVHNYYHCSLGQALFAMLPRALDVVIQVELRRLENCEEIPSETGYEKVLNNLQFEVWTPVHLLRKKITSSGFYNSLEKLEKLGFIEIKRSYDQRIKKKIRNFVVQENVEQIPQLTTKQKMLYDFILSHSPEISLAEIAKTYSYSLVKALRQKKLITIEPREITTEKNFFPSHRKPSSLTLNQEQELAVNEITSSLYEDTYRAFLLYGITGSGKTEVYIKTIHHCLSLGKSALMLVPEISLTPQMVERFYNAFGDNIAILHSRLNDRERWQQWLKIKEDKCHIVIGARSAVFAPLTNLGIIIVDEEHENSYKQENIPRYQGRDLAVIRANFEKAVVILGSATPSLESWYNTRTGKYRLLKLLKRPGKIKLPEVVITDMCQEQKKDSLFSKQLLDLIADRLNKKQQIILFQNRRGHSSFIQCLNCGALFKCPNCDISFNYHSYSESLVCHYCGLTQQIPRKCPDCGSFLFRYGSPGTQQVEKQLRVLFPSAKILRMDSDSVSGFDSYSGMFERMKNGSVDILLGTQMISKGLDFPNVTLVGVISADVGLNFPDFRAAESTFQLLTQVAGRSGRGDIPGKVIIQTHNPSHYAVTCATSQDFISFAEIELAGREELHYSPYFRLARLIFSAENESVLLKELKKENYLFSYVKHNFKKDELFLVGPAPAPLPKISKNFRYHLFIKGKDVQIIKKTVSYLKNNLKFSSRIQMNIDIDPASML